jgi:maleate cis-trans isomerase
MSTDRVIDRGRLATPAARLGLIVPSSNRLSEPQFLHYAPLDLGIHVMRLRMSGNWKRPFSELMGDIEHAAMVLADTKPDLIVFHCTGASMQEGPEGDARVLDAIRSRTGVEAISTGGAVVAALEALRIRRLVLISPYVQVTNDHEIAYLRALGFDVVHDVALGVGGSDEYIKVMPERWVDVALRNARPEADGYFLSCTNTTQIEAVSAIEEALGKPVVNSNQSVLWASLLRLRKKLAPLPPATKVGRLMETL